MKKILLTVCFLITLGIIISCDDRNPASPVPKDLTQAWILGNWIEVKFDYYYMDGDELEQGTEFYNEATTQSYTRFMQNAAYWYWIDGSQVQTDTMIYSLEAKLFSSDDYDFKMERKGDTLIVKDTFTGGYENDYYVKYDDPLPFLY
jgi:hypothetical protein